MLLMRQGKPSFPGANTGQSMKTWRLLLIGFAAALGWLLVVPLSAQEPPGCARFESFDQIDHKVCDEFLVFFEAHGGLEIFGYPISEQHIEDGRWVQYFQRVRMDYSHELFRTTAVRLALLGEEFAPEDMKQPIQAALRPKSNDPDHRYFPQTGHTVAYDFLDFFDENGGLEVFGNPITENFQQDGRRVQYFEHMLMEWDPNRGGIVLHNLGKMRYDRIAVQDLALGRSPSAGTVTDLKVVASVRNAFTQRVDEQTVWVYVYDQNDAPVEGAAVTLAGALWPGDGLLAMAPTDAEGHTETSFSVKDLEPGELVIVDAVAEYRGIIRRTGAFFFPWW
jgi:hypothetical protein